MSGFKLLAIRPLEGCDEKYRKNLIPEQIYQFYQDYKFDIAKDEKEVVSVTPLPSIIPPDLYSIKQLLGWLCTDDLRILQMALQRTKIA